MLDGLGKALIHYLTDSAKQGIFVTDAALTVRSWNNWLEYYTGVCSHEIVGRPLLEVFPQLVERRMDRFYREALTGKPVMLSERFHRYLLPAAGVMEPNAVGDTRQSAHIAPLWEGETVIGTVTFIEDVSERVLREEELQRHIERLQLAEEVLTEREAHFRSLIENGSDIIVLLDPEGVIDYASPSVQRAMEIEPENLIGKSVFDYIHPEDLQGAVQAVREAMDTDEAGPPLVGRVRHRDGSWLFLECFLKRLPGRNGRRRLVVNARDVSARLAAEQAMRESEEKYRQIFSKERDAIMLIDTATYRFLDVNDSTQALFSRSAAELYEMTLTEVSAEPEETKESIAQCVRDGSLWVPIRWYLKPDGTRFPVEISAGVFTWKGRTVMCSILRDISQRIKTEEELLRASRIEATALLAGGIAHDFNNLLSIILGNIKLVQMDLGSENPRLKPLLEAEQAVVRATQLTQKFLTFASGGAPRKRRVPVESLVSDTVQLALSGSDIGIHMELPDGLLPVEVDPKQMSEVVFNITVNAREAMPNGGTLLVTAENADLPASDLEPAQTQGTSNRYVRIAFQDSGTGISREDLPKIFDPYFSTKQRGTQKGMGLGLSVVHSIVKRHGGHLSVRSEPGQGTTIEILLPAATVPQCEAEPEAPHVEALPKGMRVLLMDDEELFRNMAGEMLRRLGCTHVGLAADGDDAVARFVEAREQGEPFETVILDLLIRGGKGGRETLARLQAIDPSIKAVATSGYHDDPVLADCRSFGFDAALEKPFRMRDLQEVLNAVAAIDRDKRLTP